MSNFGKQLQTVNSVLNFYLPANQYNKNTKRPIVPIMEPAIMRINLMNFLFSIL